MRCHIVLGFLTAVFAASGPAPVALRADGTNLLDDTLPQYALDSGRPRFEWTPLVADGTRGMRQKSFSLVVREAAYPAVPVIWSLGPLLSGTPSFVFNGTHPLKSGTMYEWAVSTVLTDGITEVASALSPFARSERPQSSHDSCLGFLERQHLAGNSRMCCARLFPRRFRISLLPASDDPWDGVAWLGSDSLNVYETQFRLSTLPSEATLYVCGLGFSSVSVNGFTLDAALVTAPWTANERLVGFSALDIHTFLRPDALNNLTISLGMGWRDQSAFGYIDGGELQNDKTARVLRAQLRTAPNTTLTHTVTHPRLAPPHLAPPRLAPRASCY